MGDGQIQQCGRKIRKRSFYVITGRCKHLPDLRMIEPAGIVLLQDLQTFFGLSKGNIHLRHFQMNGYLADLRVSILPDQQAGMAIQRNCSFGISRVFQIQPLYTVDPCAAIDDFKAVRIPLQRFFYIGYRINGIAAMNMISVMNILL